MSDSMIKREDLAEGTSNRSADATIEVGREFAHGQSVVIALDTTACLSFSRDREERRRLKTRDALIFDIEEYLPLDAEDLAVGVIDSGVESLVVATDASKLLSRVQAIESAGGYVSAICPTVMLAFATLARQESLKRYDIVVWNSEEGFDLLRLHRGRPVAWNWCEDETFLSESLLRMNSESESLMFLQVGDDDAELSIGSMTKPTRRIRLGRSTASALEAKRLNEGRVTALVDLRDGAIQTAFPFRPVGRSLWGFVIAAFFLQTVLIASAWVAAGRYQALTQQSVQDQEAAFREVFPEQSIPVGITARLESERRRLAGTRGVAGGELPEVESVLPVLHVFLSGMPEFEAAKFELDGLSFSAGKVHGLSGTAKSYQDLEYLAERLRNAGLAVPPVSATTTRNGVSIRIDEIPHADEEAESL